MTRLVLLSLVFGIGSAYGSGDPQGSQPWGPEELLEASKAAFVAFEANMSEQAYENIQGFSVKMRSQKNAATVKVTYEEDGVEDTESFFCHNHDDAIDCH